MIQPTIIFYARLDFDLSSKKTPKYIITRAWGNYSPLNKITGRNGMVSMYLLPKREVQPSNCPPMHLQGKNSLNITGLKDYFLDGKLSGFAYGYPLSEPTYGKDKKPNPFYPNREDGFLFIVHQDKEAPTPSEQQRPDYIEMIVLQGCKILAASYCKQLVLGGFDKALSVLRHDAVSIG